MFPPNSSAKVHPIVRWGRGWRGGNLEICDHSGFATVLQWPWGMGVGGDMPLPKPYLGTS